MATILFIESNPEILDNLSEGFELEGYNVLAAKDGSIGIELAKEFLPDIIVSEIQTGNIDGYEVLRLLLSTPETYDIPFIFSTTKYETRDKVICLGLGADDYIIKPFGLKHLSNMIKIWINSGSQRSFVTERILK